MSCNYICPTSIVQEIESVPEDGYAPFFFPPEGDLLAFYFTDQTFERVYSALVNGSQLTYGNEGTQVLWDFLQNVEYPVTICAKMIDCITNDSDVRDALYNWLNTDPRAKNLIQDIVSKGSSGGGGVGVTAEDDDALFGACTFLIDTMHDAITDFNQQAELGTNLRERANIILQAIPVFGDAIASIPEYIDELFDNVIEIFDGQYTDTPITGSRDRLRCGLFCLAQANDRSLTWELIQTYFWDLVSFESTIPNLALDFVGFLATGSWAGQDVVNISFANMATAMSVGSKFGSQNFPNLQTIMSLGLNNPDSDWMTVCEDCPEPEWEQVFDFTIDEQGWTPALANYVSGEGFVNTLSGTLPYTCDIALAIPSWGDAAMTRIRVHAYSLTATASGFRGIYDTGFTNPESGYLSSVSDYTMDFNPPVGTTPANLSVQVSNQPTEFGANKIVSVTINGTGTNPFL